MPLFLGPKRILLINSANDLAPSGFSLWKTGNQNWRFNDKRIISIARK